ncbi:MAG TPA: SIMPL domain-containing protein [Pyrinomonadaceae bacterium]|nr:SIMPL domain-containing protein [Pyrinomonadaceae bacterium]
MSKRQLMTLLLAVAALAASAGCAREVEVGAVRSRVLVTGESGAKAQPDTAVIVLSVVTQSPRAVEAQQANARKSEGVIAAAKAAAGANVEVRTSDYSLQPQRDWWGGQPRITGYEARNTVTVTTGDLDRVGAVIDAATQAGANSVEGIEFVLREANPARRETLAEATRQAMTKAESIAQALGGRVVRVVESQEGDFPPRPLLDQGERGEAASYQSMNANTSVARKSPRTPVEAGPLDIKSHVQLVVEIEARPEVRNQ